MPDYIPGSDTEFLAWVDNFVAYIVAHPIELGVGPPAMAPIQAAQTDFQTKLPKNITAQLASQSARQAKDDSRDALESLIRQLVRQLQASDKVDDAERAALGITVPDRVLTMGAGDIPTRPVGMVDTSQRLRHEIRFFDEATPTSRAKPQGMMGCEIWVKVGEQGDPPADPGELSFLAMDTASPYVAEYDGADGGKTAHYMLRWVKTGGDKGPWSETISATITA